MVTQVREYCLSYGFFQIVGHTVKLQRQENALNRAKERYSIPVFLSGNPDFIVERIPTCQSPGNPAKFGPITVQDAVSATYAESYGRVQLYKQRLHKPMDNETHGLVKEIVVS